MEHMVHSESEKFKTELFEVLKQKFQDKFSDDDMSFMNGAVNRYLREMITLMRESKSVHEKFFSDIILHSVDGILGYNKEQNIFLWNDGAEKIFGYKKEEMMNRNVSVIVVDTPKAREDFEFINRETAEKGFISNFETYGLSKDGTRKILSISQHIVFDEKNEKLGTVAIIRDITLVKQLEKELRESENLALIGQVVSSIAHNISNPLNIISGNADYLLIDKKKEEEGYEELKIIVDETTRITKSIRQILNFARPLAPMREKTTMNEIVKDATAGFKFLIGEKPVELKLKLEKNPKFVKVDREMFKDIIQNLLTNSVHAIPIGRNGVIEIKTSSENGSCSVKISDNGIGIPESDVSNIFKPFYSTKGYGKGTGLGLAFTERVVKEHGGSISVSTENNLGVSFVIKLPLF
jgi:PAS domain S-box-containing protein